MADPAAFLRKADESLAGAELEFAAGYYNNCANRCYYACYQAAIFALMHEGVLSRVHDFWKHDFVQAEFIGQFINRRKLYPSELREVFHRNHTLRMTADYQEAAISRQEAERAIQRSRLFLQHVHRRGVTER
ncbi:MAG: HEPN domain-containing protein [Chloroflexi bacterium]|nr:HEPN domain-containing protein [Chloroflexota bacterium]